MKRNNSPAVTTAANQQTRRANVKCETSVGDLGRVVALNLEGRRVSRGVNGSRSARHRQRFSVPSCWSYITNQHPCRCGKLGDARRSLKNKTKQKQVTWEVTASLDAASGIGVSKPHTTGIYDKTDNLHTAVGLSFSRLVLLIHHTIRMILSCLYVMKAPERVTCEQASVHQPLHCD